MDENLKPAFLFPHTYHGICRAAEGTRLALALIAGIPLLLSFLVPVKELPRIACLFLEITGLPCPFCGFIRSIWAISSGNWGYATTNCPLAWLLYLAMAIVFSWNAAAMLFGGKPARVLPVPIGRFKRHLISEAAIVLVLANWVYRLCLGFW